MVGFETSYGPKKIFPGVHGSQGIFSVLASPKSKIQNYQLPNQQCFRKSDRTVPIGNQPFRLRDLKRRQ